MVPMKARAKSNLSGFLDVLRRRALVVAVAIGVVVGVAVLTSLTQTSRYRSNSEVLIREVPFAAAASGQASAGTARSLANQVRLAEARMVVDAARSLVGNEPDLDVRADAHADVLHFTAASSDAALAATAADTYAEAFIAQRRESLVAEYMASGEVIEARMAELDLEIEALGPNSDRRLAILEAQQVRYSELLSSLLLSAELAQGGGAQLIRPAEIADGPFEPTTSRNVLLALVVGLLLGLGGAILFEYLDTSLRNEIDLALASGGLITLGTVPELPSSNVAETPRIIVREQPESTSAEAYRALRTSVQFLGIDRTIGTIGFTSPGPGEGKTTTATNLAVACARAGQRVVLVDCDLRTPRVHEFFGLSNDIGFTTVLLGEASLDTAAHRITGEPGLVVITSGPIPPDPSELLSGKRARSLITSVAAQADLVIIDAPPVLAVTDPLIVAGMVDGMILVASAGRTNRDHVAEAVEQLQLVDAPMLGTVLNRQSASDSRYGYGYGAYGAESPKTSKTPKTSKAPTVDRTPAESQDWGALPASSET